jgi:hypothetical protein
MKNTWNKTKDGRKSIKRLKDYFLIGSDYINEIERSKSSNSRCHSCDKLIGKNTLRGIHTRASGDERHFTMRFVYCSKCTTELIETRINELKKLKSILKTRERTRKMSYKKQVDLQLKDELLKKLNNNGI